VNGGNGLKNRTLMLLLLFQLAFVPVVSATAIFALSPQIGQAIDQTNPNGPYDRVAIAISAGLAVGLAALGAGMAISASGTAAISALAEKPETFFRSFLVVALAEAIAIYGLIVGILLWLKL
jgi:V/A-type H+-transporting ATPase subunit K